ncbi:adenylate kinase [Candidatus Bathyarchaeota archaeon]|nr:adenylate kinase [Candidatus Bathyarchaeota archaeon]NIU81643.1 adenylate kinase [Candidatus Bathyarchaeota archaeon]NIV68455.1 adenylate kinase [Candidatus Bathyarchaeota archaeon]NIW16637.1 adenylate kinase [Candidatus Bathyarchaeota archaeon]NIW34831.1 adenylate kinase [Candidatus Bathyarchaeota archaeon]
MHFVVFGPPGAGKGTYASILASKLNIAKISTGDLFREEIKQDTDLGKRIVKFVKGGKLVPDEIVNDIVRDKISQASKKRGFILDGYPRTIEQAETLDKMTSIDAVIRLRVPQWVIIERLSNRRICKNCGAVYNEKYLKPKRPGVCDKCGGSLYQRQDDKPEVIKERLKVYEAQTQPLIDHYQDEVPFVEIECNSVEIPPEDIVEKMLHKLHKKSLIE